LTPNEMQTKPAVVLEIKDGKFLYRETISPEPE
jgi:hypothetical protein